MIQSVVDLMELTQENVWDLTEEDVFSLVKTVQTDVEKEKRSHYMKIIGSAFEFRTISSKRRDLKKNFEVYGYKFFPAGDNPNMLTGIYKRKRTGK